MFVCCFPPFSCTFDMAVFLLCEACSLMRLLAESACGRALAMAKDALPLSVTESSELTHRDSAVAARLCRDSSALHCD